LAEFGTDLRVICVDVIDASRKTRLLSQLLPDAFDASNLPSNP
jgi:cytidine deaminase